MKFSAPQMVFREAVPADIQRIQVVRNLVKENVLSNPALVSDEDCYEYIVDRGKGWVCEVNGIIVGFAIADLKDHNIWALFLQPEYERMGIGRKLQEIMLNWYFDNSNETCWLSTAKNSRAESFYRISGWTETGLTASGEVKFEMTKQQFLVLSSKF